MLSEHGDPHFRHKILKKLTPVVFSTFRELSPDEKIRVEYLMEYQSSAMLNTITKWYTRGKDIPVQEFLDLLISITTNGIQSELLQYKKTP